jgi:hypothetical protein
VREVDGPAQVRAVGERPDLGTSVRGGLEPPRAKMTMGADRDRLHKRPGGRFTVRPQPGGAGGRNRHPSDMTRTISQPP